MLNPNLFLFFNSVVLLWSLVLLVWSFEGACDGTPQIGV